MLMSGGSTKQASFDAVGVYRRSGRHWRQAAGGPVPHKKPDPSGRYLNLEDRLRIVDLHPIPAAEALGLSVAAWRPLAGGLLGGKFSRSTPAEQGTRVDSGTLSDRRRSIAAAVTDVARELGVAPAQVAIAWAMARSRVELYRPSDRSTPARSSTKATSCSPSWNPTATATPSD